MRREVEDMQTKVYICEAKNCNEIVTGELADYPIKLCKKHRAILNKELKKIGGI